MSATTIEFRNFKYVPAYYGDQGLVLPFIEGASQSFAADDPVKLSSGSIVATAIPPTTDVILGFAQKAATGVTGAVIPVRVIRPSDVYQAHFEVGDTFTAASVGAFYGIARDEDASGHYWVIDKGNTTDANAPVVVLGSEEWTRGSSNLNSENPFSANTGVLSASSGGPVYCRFREAHIEFTATE